MMKACLPTNNQRKGGYGKKESVRSVTNLLTGALVLRNLCSQGRPDRSALWSGTRPLRVWVWVWVCVWVVFAWRSANILVFRQLCLQGRPDRSALWSGTRLLRVWVWVWVCVWVRFASLLASVLVFRNLCSQGRPDRSALWSGSRTLYRARCPRLSPATKLYI